MRITQKVSPQLAQITGLGPIAPFRFFLETLVVGRREATPRDYDRYAVDGRTFVLFDRTLIPSS